MRVFLQRKKTPKATTADGEANGETAAVEGDAPAASATGEKGDKKMKPKRERKPRVPRAEGEDPTGEPSKVNPQILRLSQCVLNARHRPHSSSPT